MSIQDVLSTVGNANDITVVRTANHEQNSYLHRLNKDKLQIPIKFAEKQQKQMVDLKAILNAAKNNERKEIKDNEQEPKKFALLQRYGYILEKIENLIGIISFDFEDLSFAEQGDEIEKLLKTRKINERQVTYEYYQELFTSTTDSLMVIESSFENGSITADEALAQIRALKLDFRSNVSEVPLQFQESSGEIQHLLNMYEEAFSQAKAPAFTTINNPFGLNEATKIQLQNLNMKTKELQQNTEILYKKVSEFDPVVDLGALCTQLRDTDNFFKDDWELDAASYKVSALESTTNNLYNEQVYKNEQRANYAAEIKNLTASTIDLNKKTKEEVTLREHDQSNTRAQAILNRLPTLKQMLDGGATSIPENLASQLGNCYSAVVDQDKEISIDIAAKTETSQETFDLELNNLAQDELYELQDYIKELSMERSPKLHNKQDDDEDEENKPVGF